MSKMITGFMAMVALAVLLMCGEPLRAEASATQASAPTIKVTSQTDERGVRYAVSLRLADGDEGPSLRLAVGENNSAGWGPDGGARSVFSAKIEKVADGKVSISCKLMLNERNVAEEWRLEAEVEQDKWVDMKDSCAEIVALGIGPDGRESIPGKLNGDAASFLRHINASHVSLRIPRESLSFAPWHGKLAGFVCDFSIVNRTPKPLRKGERRAADTHNSVCCVVHAGRGGVWNRG